MPAFPRRRLPPVCFFQFFEARIFHNRQKYEEVQKKEHTGGLDACPG